MNTDDDKFDALEETVAMLVALAVISNARVPKKHLELRETMKEEITRELLASFEEAAEQDKELFDLVKRLHKGDKSAWNTVAEDRGAYVDQEETD